ncbi:MAG: hypothetical protein ACOX28_02075 [Bacilli bacterium]|jgi:hypothetical protein
MKKITKLFTALSLVALLAGCTNKNDKSEVVSDDTQHETEIPTETPSEEEQKEDYFLVSYSEFKEKALATAALREDLEEYYEIELTTYKKTKLSETEKITRSSKDESRNLGTEAERSLLTFIMANSVDKEFKDLGSYGTEEKAAGVNFYISNPSENFKVEPPVDKETGNYEITYTIYNKYGYMLELYGETYEANELVRIEKLTMVYTPAQ